MACSNSVSQDCYTDWVLVFNKYMLFFRKHLTIFAKFGCLTTSFHRFHSSNRSWSVFDKFKLSGTDQGEGPGEPCPHPLILGKKRKNRRKKSRKGKQLITYSLFTSSPYTVLGWEKSSTCVYGANCYQVQWPHIYLKLSVFLHKEAQGHFLSPVVGFNHTASLSSEGGEEQNPPSNPTIFSLFFSFSLIIEERLGRQRFANHILFDALKCK